MVRWWASCLHALGDTDWRKMPSEVSNVLVTVSPRAYWECVANLIVRGTSNHVTAVLRLIWHNYMLLTTMKYDYTSTRQSHHSLEVTEKKKETLTRWHFGRRPNFPFLRAVLRYRYVTDFPAIHGYTTIWLDYSTREWMATSRSSAWLWRQRAVCAVRR